MWTKQTVKLIRHLNSSELIFVFFFLSLTEGEKNGFGQSGHDEHQFELSQHELIRRQLITNIGLGLKQKTQTQLTELQQTASNNAIIIET